MRLSILLLAAVALRATPVAAEVFRGAEGVFFSLSREMVTNPADAELSVTAEGVSAKYGIKRSRRGGDFEKQEVTAFGEPYDLKDRGGGRWRMWIRSAAGKVIEIELLRLHPLVKKADRVFHVVAVTIDGLRAEPTFAPLTLRGDGSYRLGTVRGRYRLDEKGVTLDGIPATWGRGAYTVNKDGLTFRFLRGHIVYEVKYHQRRDARVAQNPAGEPE
jgi:hypothetical protein